MLLPDIDRIFCNSRMERAAGALSQHVDVKPAAARSQRAQARRPSDGAAERSHAVEPKVHRPGPRGSNPRRARQVIIKQSGCRMLLVTISGLVDEGKLPISHA